MSANIGQTKEVSHVIQLPGTVRKGNAPRGRRDPLLTHIESLPPEQQRVWRGLLDLAASAHKAGYYPGLPFLIGGSEEVFGKWNAGHLSRGGITVTHNG